MPHAIAACVWRPATISHSPTSTVVRSEDWLEQGLAALASAPRVAGRIHLELSDSPSTAELVDAGRFLRQRRYVEEGFGATANLFVRRSVFDSLGGFDEHLKSGGDYEFGSAMFAGWYSNSIRRKCRRQSSGPRIASRASLER